jgi:hypothetical protein
MRYVSEPILADVAAGFMTDKSCLLDILKLLNDLIAQTMLSSTGSIGELVAQLILLIGKDQAAHNEFKDKENIVFLHSKSITVKSYLTALVGQHNYNTYIRSLVSPDFCSGLISFSHFTQKLDILKKDDLIRDFFGRNAACMFKQNFPIYDATIPVAMSNGKVGMILFQFKNRTEAKPVDGNVRSLRKKAFCSLYFY